MKPWLIDLPGSLHWLLAIALVGATGVSLLFTAVIRRVAIQKNIHDVPNKRSLHKVTTPRGGGLSLAVLGLGALFLVYGFTLWLFAGILVAAVGWLDDRHGISARIRLGVHFVAAGLFAYWLTELPVSPLQTDPILSALSPWVAVPLIALSVAWSINYYNFMDGSDGICAGHAASVLLATLVIAALSGWGFDERQFFPHVTIAGACLGFLFWNWSPARIFMGDVGSGFLGFAIGTLAFQSAPVSWLTVLLLNLPFLADSCFTLARRALRRARLSQAHREHAYQKCVLSGWSHAQVALLYVAAVWLVCLPAAWFTRGSAPATAAVCVFVGAGFSFWAWTRGAGKAERH